MRDLLISRGIVKIGHIIRDKDGNIKEKEEGGFISDENGLSLAMVEVDENNNIITPAEISHIEDYNMILRYICEKLNIKKNECEFVKLTSLYPIYDYEFECSNCSREFGWNDKEDLDRVRYCPYCGAKITNELSEEDGE
jgi:DNA-directed RNA polymerase subunit RPC12/RpoP